MTTPTRITKAAEVQADKVVGITKLAQDTFKENYKTPDSLHPLVRIQFTAGALSEYQRSQKLVDALREAKAEFVAYELYVNAADCEKALKEYEAGE